MGEQDFERRLSSALPLDAVQEVTVRPRWIALRGPDWDMDFDAAWRVTDGTRTLFGWSSRDATERTRELVGLGVTSIEYEGNELGPKGPSAVVFDSGWRLELFQDFGTRQGAGIAFSSRRFRPTRHN